MVDLLFALELIAPLLLAKLILLPLNSIDLHLVLQPLELLLGLLLVYLPLDLRAIRLLLAIRGRGLPLHLIESLLLLMSSLVSL
jgi:hypothetical protein